MKTLFKYLLRDKVDLIMFILTVVAVVQWFFIGRDVTPGIALLALYVFGAIIRFGVLTDTIMRQDQEIKKLNEQIHEKNEFIKSELNQKP